jgi:succinyl-CoA synthetase beta subunit
VRLDEHDAKAIFAAHGVRTPEGELATSPVEAEAAARALGLPVYVKALTTASSRAARGGVLRVDEAARVGPAFIAATAAVGVGDARVESAIDVGDEWFFAIGYFPGRRGPVLFFSDEGGSGIEERATAVSEVEVDPLLGLRPFHLRDLLSGVRLGEEMSTAFADVARRLYDLFVSTDALLVEVNPLSWDGSGFVALDGRIEVDDFARSRHADLWTLRSAQEHDRADSGFREHGIDFVELSGRIGIMGLGAGLTMLLADWITEEGGEPAFFCDLTVAAVRDWEALFAGSEPAGFVRASRYALDRTLGDIDVLLVNFTSGGTPVDGLFKGFLSALSSRDWPGAVVAHAGGNRSEQASRLLSRRGIDLQPSLGEAVRAAVAASANAR